MSILENFQNMNDTSFKPRLLNSLIKDHIAIEKHTRSNPSDLSFVVSSIKIHGLLSESLPKSSSPKLVKRWKNSVDEWIDRLLLLLSSEMPDQCWTGACLLGVTFQECSPNRILESYAVWFQKLFLLVQTSSAQPPFVKIATCAALSDLFTRLEIFNSAKKDTTSYAGKLIQPVLKMLNEEKSEVMMDGAINLLCTLLTYFPYSVHRHYDEAESIIVSKIMNEKCSDITYKFAKCLALLPNVRGDESSWSTMMNRTLLAINMIQNDAFHGLEEESKSKEAIKLLSSPGKDPPSPFGIQFVTEEISLSETRFKQYHKIPALIYCCCMMLTNPYPVQVTVPVHPLLALVRRILAVDGSLCQATPFFVTAFQQELICSELPILHSYSLDLLETILKGVRSQVLPHAANIVLLLKDYSTMCVLPILRIKLYSIMRILLTSMGFGVALSLGKLVIKNAISDLHIANDGNTLSPDLSPSVENKKIDQSVRYKMTDKLPPKDGSRKSKELNHKKRKIISESPEESENEVGNEQPPPQISVQIAALRALEALLTVGGTLEESKNLDHILVTIASKTWDVKWASEPMDEKKHFQLAAYGALLASLLSSEYVPRYLSQGLELFRQGKQETGTTLAEFCAHALLALEVLIHHRPPLPEDLSLNNHAPLIDRSKKKLHDSMYSNNQNSEWASRESALSRETDLDDYDTCLEGNEDTRENTHADPQTNVTNDNLEGNLEKIINLPSGTLDEIAGTTTETYTELEKSGKVENVVEQVELIKESTINRDEEMYPLCGTEQMSKPSNATISDDNIMASDLLARVEPTKESIETKPVLSGFNKFTYPMMSKDDGDSDSVSLDSLPDIVDGDPDSD